MGGVTIYIYIYLFIYIYTTYTRCMFFNVFLNALLPDNVPLLSEGSHLRAKARSFPGRSGKAAAVETACGRKSADDSRTLGAQIITYTILGDSL